MVNNDIPFDMDIFKGSGIQTEEIVIADDVSNDPDFTIYQSNDEVSYGVIYYWKTGDLVLEVLDWGTGDQIYNQRTTIDNYYFHDILTEYINNMKGLVRF